jgi:putative phosphoesterase
VHLLFETALIVSDTHGCADILAAVLRWVKDSRPEVRQAAFLGDGEDDIAKAETVAGCAFEWVRVRGNMDFTGAFSQVVEFAEKGLRFFLSHGNIYHVELGTDTIAAAALASGASCVLYGHTHVPHFEFADTVAGREIPGGMWFINPGSLGKPRTQAGSTFVLLKVDGASLDADFFSVEEKRKNFIVKPAVL